VAAEQFLCDLVRISPAVAGERGAKARGVVGAANLQHKSISNSHVKFRRGIRRC
jgi:hypothetical protein